MQKLTESITYAELVAKISTSTLHKGASYTITDFATTHYLQTGGIILDPIPVVGTIEPLLVTAISNNILSNIALSPLYPQDIIHYDWNPAKWLEDASFVDGVGAIIAGFKGVIYFRHDTLYDNYMGYDFRNVKFRRYKTAATPWTIGATFAKGAFCQDATGIFKSLVAGNIGNAITDSTKWLMSLDFSITQYWHYDPTSVNGIPSGVDFIDVKTFVETTGTGTYDLSVRSNHFEPFKDNIPYNATSTGGILANNVFYLSPSVDYFSIYSNKIGAGFSYNTIGDSFYYNTIGNSFRYNTIGNSFDSNTIGNSFYYNTIGNSFNSNTIGNSFYFNTIGNSFYSNTIGNYFDSNTIGNNSNRNTIGNSFNSNTIGNSFYFNTIGNYFDSNTIGNSFYFNTIGNSFYSNTIGNSFRYNTVKDGSIGAGIDFSLSTHIYATYNCELFNTSTGTKKLSYVDGIDNTIKIVDVNA